MVELSEELHLVVEVVAMCLAGATEDSWVAGTGLADALERLCVSQKIHPCSSRFPDPPC